MNKLNLITPSKAENTITIITNHLLICMILLSKIITDKYKNSTIINIFMTSCFNKEVPTSTNNNIRPTISIIIQLSRVIS